MKVYYVSGKDFMGNKVVEKVEADSPAQARRLAFKVASHSKVFAGKNGYKA